jgi:hypothetical protein
MIQPHGNPGMRIRVPKMAMTQRNILLIMPSFMYVEMSFVNGKNNDARISITMNNTYNALCFRSLFNTGFFAVTGTEQTGGYFHVSGMGHYWENRDFVSWTVTYLLFFSFFIFLFSRLFLWGFLTFFYSFAFFSHNMLLLQDF